MKCLKYLLLSIITCYSLAAVADDYTLYGENVKVENGTQTAAINFYMTNAETISALQFDIVLPEGVDVYYGMNEDEEYAYFIDKGERAKSQHVASYNKIGEREYRIMVASSTNATFKETVDSKVKPVVTITLDLTNVEDDQRYQMNITNIVLSHYDTESFTTVPFYSADSQCFLTVGNSMITNEIALIDGDPYTKDETNELDALTFSKAFSASAVGKWNAFYVPMSVNVEEYAGELDFAEIYAFCAMRDTNGDGVVDANDENFLYVYPLTTGITKPNVPYLIRPREAKTYVINSADNVLYAAAQGMVEFSTARDKFTVTGLYEPFTVVAGDNNYYVSSTGTLDYRTTGSTTVKANRWIMHRESKEYGGGSGNAAASSTYRIVAIGEDIDEATAIKLINAANEQGTTNVEVYSLDGRKVNAMRNLRTGVYIKNGQKIIVK